MKSNIDNYSLNKIILEEIDRLKESRQKSSRTKSGKKVPGKYLTKDKPAMKGEIERVSKLKSNDPDAYGKWVADYKERNTKKGQPYKTKKSAATIAYEKRFGKKNENVIHKDNNEKLDSDIFDLFINTDKRNWTLEEMWDFWVRKGYEEEMPWVTKKDFQKRIKIVLKNHNKMNSINESKIRNTIKSLINEIYSGGEIGKLADITGVDVTDLLPYSDLLTRIAKRYGYYHDLTLDVSRALDIKNAHEREQSIINTLKKHGVYEKFFHYLRMNEDKTSNEVYPLIVGEKKQNRKK